MMKVLASRGMHSFPSLLGCDLTLPGDTLTAEHACYIPSWTRKSCTAFSSVLTSSEDFSNIHLIHLYSPINGRKNAV